jgi:iron complex outermembrane recepter protein
MAKYHRSRLLSYACAYALGIAGSAYAQAPADAPVASSLIEEIVVTAQKREESLQDVPVAITAMTAEKRDLIGVQTIEDMTNFVPGLTYDTLFDRANIRGIGRVTNAAGSDPGVALYVDGFYTSSTTSAGRSTIFNDRVEVLRGPQGTLYGRNATGGAINTVSRAPKDEFGAEVRASYGNYDRKIVQGTVTGPITDWLRFRLTGGYIKQDEGYFNNIGPGPDEGSVQDDRDYDATFAMDLGENVDLTLRYARREQYSLNRLSASFTPYTTNFTCAAGCSVTTTQLTPTIQTSAGTSFGTFNAAVPNSLYNTGTGLVPAAPQYTVLNPATPNNRREFNSNTPQERVLDGSDTLVANLIWHLSAFDIKWIGGYNRYDFYSLTDSDSAGRESYVYTPPPCVTAAGAPTSCATPGAVANPGTAFPVTIYTEPFLRFYEDKRYWSNELNFTSTGDGPFQWLAGLYQYREDYYQVPIAAETRQSPLQTELQTVYVRPAALPTGAGATAIYDSWGAAQLAAPNPAGASSSAATDVIVHSYAAFGQIDWSFTEQWKMTLGARYSIDQKEGYEIRRRIIWDPTFAGSRAKAFDNSPPLGCSSTAGETDPANANLQAVRNLSTGALTAITNCNFRVLDEREWKDVSGTAGMEWKPVDGYMVYGKYSRGYKSGAIRLGGFDADSEVDPEFINAFEIGGKMDIAAQLQINTSVYYYDYKGYQFPLSFRDPGSTTLRTEYTNLDAESLGAELETIWVPIDSMNIQLAYSYADSEVKSDIYLSDTLDTQATGPESITDVIITAYQAGFSAANCPMSLYLQQRAAYMANPSLGLASICASAVSQNARGSRLPGSPEHKVSFNISYGLHLGAGTLTPSVTYSWRDRVGNSTGLLARSTISTPSYYTTDGRITWSDDDGRYSIIAAVANALDDETYNTATAQSINGEIVQTFNLNPPRTYSLEVQYRFGSEKR